MHANNCNDMFVSIHHVLLLACPLHINCTFYCLFVEFFLALVITDGPMNVTVCSGTNAEISCGFTGVDDPWYILFNSSWRIIKRNKDGYVISNETVRIIDINNNRTDGLLFIIITTNSNGIESANDSYLSVGPVDDTYNNTSYQCIFTINDTIIESDTAGTITVIGMYVRMCIVFAYIIVSVRYLISIEFRCQITAIVCLV